MASFKFNLSDDSLNRLFSLQLKALEIKAKHRSGGKTHPEELIALWTDGRLQVNRLRATWIELYCDENFVMRSHSIEVVADYIIMEFERNITLSKGLL